MSAISESRPWKSRSIAVPKAQVAEFNEELKKRGIQNCGFDEKGHAIAHSRAGRNELMKLRGGMDLDGGYGDYCGK